MVVVEVFREPIYRRYFAPLLTSHAFLHCAVTVVVAILLPLIIAYQSSNFWLKSGVYYEQPEVSFRFQTVMNMHGLTGEGSPLSFFWSSSSALNQIYYSGSTSSLVKIPIFTTSTVDTNADGITDRIEVSAQVPMDAGTVLTGLDMALFHDVRLGQKARYEFDAMSYVSIGGYSSGIASARVDADMMFRQTWPLVVKGGYTSPYNGSPLLMDASVDPRSLSVHTADLSAILTRNADRNFSLATSINYQHVAVLPMHSQRRAHVVNITAVLRVHQQAIRYTPPVSEVLQWAWVQYMVVFIPVAFLLYRLTGFALRNKLIHAHVATDVAIMKKTL